MHHFQHQESLAAIACVCKCGYVCVYYFIQIIYIHMGFPGGTSGKESSCQCRRHKRHRFDPESGRSPGEGHGNPLQYSCLENCMDRGAWQATVHGVAKSQTRLKWLSTHIFICVCVFSDIVDSYIGVSSESHYRPVTGLSVSSDIGISTSVDSSVSIKMFYFIMYEKY